MRELPDLARRLEQLRHRYPQADHDMVAAVVRAVLGTMRGDVSASEAALLSEVEELARTVANARAEIAALRADDITASHIPSATDELDAIVAHTAGATNDILECCETLDGLAARLAGEDARIMQDVVTRIYEACGFQDITGQRITKIVATLKTIEVKIAHIIEVFRRDCFDGDIPQRAAMTHGLENGPQLPALAMDQSDIDALLASFD